MAAVATQSATLPPSGELAASAPPMAVANPPAEKKEGQESVAADMTKAQVSDEKPSDKTIEEVLEMQVQDAKGQKHSLASLVTDETGATPRTVLVFIRHFFCSFCQEYVRSLSSDLPTTKLSGLTPPTRLVIIGCGSPSLISKYAAETKSAFPIYADPSRAIYERLGFAVNVGGITSQMSKPTAYLRRSFIRLALSTVRQFSTAGTGTFAGGKVSQNGGEMVFDAGKLIWWHRMTNTSDHTDPADLEKVLAQ